MAEYITSSTSTNRTDTTTLSNGSAENIFQLIKEVPYGATVGTTTGGFHSIFQTSWSYPNKVDDLKRLTIRNTGVTALEVELQIDSWTNGTPDANISSPAQRILRFMIPVGEHLYIPNLRLVDFSTSGSAGDAYALDNVSPASINSGYLFQDSGSTLGANLEDSETTVTANASTHPFYVGDLIQVGLDTATTTRQEIMRVTAISGATLTVDRALYGTSKADKDSQTNGTNGAVSGARIYIPFFNIESNSNHYNGYATAQTSNNGIFHIKNFFGYGRYTSNIAGGLVPGSVSGKFYLPGYQSLGMSGITSSTHSGLAASTEYGFDITVDGSGNLTSDYMKFTTDSSNLNFGGSNGIINKMQSALDEQYYTTSSAVHTERVIVSIVDGDIRFTSGQALSASAILLAAPSAGETTPFGVGRFPAIGSVRSPVGALLPSDTIIDRTSGVTKPNRDVFFYDDGHSNIRGAVQGTVNYETGELRLTSCPRNANFVVSANYGSAMSGGVRTSAAASRNSINSISARSLNLKVNGQLEVIGYE